MEFTCYATKHKYQIRRISTCNTKSVIYFITSKCCSKQYTGSSTSFAERFRIDKSDINTGRIRYGVANHHLNVCKSAMCKMKCLQVNKLIKLLLERVKIFIKFYGKLTILAGATLYYNIWVT